MSHFLEFQNGYQAKLLPVGKSLFNCLNGSRRKNPNNKKALIVLEHDQSERPEKGNQEMKNQNRVHLKGGQSKSVSQAPNHAEIAARTEQILLTVRMPELFFPLLDKGVHATDSDRSKFVRDAIREKLARHGIKMKGDVEIKNQQNWPGSSLHAALQNLEEIHAEMNFFVQCLGTAIHSWQTEGELSDQEFERQQVGFYCLWHCVNTAANEQLEAAMNCARAKGGAR
jgi:hypothetical protein